jgi:hypothetical protein
MNRIPRFNACVDGETVFLKDARRGGLVNAEILISRLQESLSKNRKIRENDNSYQKSVTNGRISKLEEILRALGEEPV